MQGMRAEGTLPRYLEKPLAKGSPAVDDGQVYGSQSPDPTHPDDRRPLSRESVSHR
jgi:hypothetical protein